MTAQRRTRTLFSVAVGLILLAPPLADATTTDQAALLELNQDGLDLMAAELNRSALKDLANKALPDYHDNIAYGVRLTVEGLAYSAKFRDFKLQLVNGRLDASVRIHDVQIHAERLKFRKRVLGKTLRSTCRHTTVKMGFREGLPLRTRMGLSVANGDVNVDMERVQFAIDKNDYTVKGPKECSGDIGVGRLLKSLTHSILEHSRSQIEDALKRQVARLDGQLADELNKQSRMNLAVQVDVPPLPSSTIVVQTKPHAIDITRNRLRIELGAEVQRHEERSKLVSDKRTGRGLGELGLNPELLNEVLNEIVGDGLAPVELDEQEVPGLEEILRVHRASAIWPDLLIAPVTDKRLKLAIGMDQAPQFRLDERDQIIQLHIDHLTLNFIASIRNQWIPYFKFDLQVRADIEVIEHDGEIALRLVSSPLHSTEGQWSSEYKPIIRRYEKDLADTILSSALDYLYFSGPLWRGSLETPDVSGRRLGLFHPRIESPYVRMRVGVLD